MNIFNSYNLNEMSYIKYLKYKLLNKKDVSCDVLDTLMNQKSLSDIALKIYTNLSDEDIKKFKYYDTNLENLIIKMLNALNNNKNKLKNPNKISSIKRIEDLNSLLNEIYEYDDAKKIFKSNIQIFLNDYEYFIYKPLNFKASKKYAYQKNNNKNWCTTYNTNEFKKYFGDDGTITYVINKYDNKKSYAICVVSNYIRIWDYNNDLIASFKFNNIDDYKQNISKVFNNVDKQPYISLVENFVLIIKNDVTKFKIINSIINEIYKINDFSVEILSLLDYDVLFDFIDKKSFFDNIKENIILNTVKEIDKYNFSVINKKMVIDFLNAKKNKLNNEFKSFLVNLYNENVNELKEKIFEYDKNIKNITELIDNNNSFFTKILNFVIHNDFLKYDFVNFYANEYIKNNYNFSIKKYIEVNKIKINNKNSIMHIFRNYINIDKIINYLKNDVLCKLDIERLLKLI